MEKNPWFRFWVLNPLKNLGGSIANMYYFMFGYWYCAGCKKYHSPRVVKHLGPVLGKVFDMTLRADVCSLHKEESHG